MSKGAHFVEAMPKHVAIIMDGNGRWAKARGFNRFYGHRAGAEAAKAVLKEAIDASIPYLSLYAFSQENRHRPLTEVDNLLKLYHELLQPNHIRDLIEKGIALRFIGDVEGLDPALARRAQACAQATAKGTRLTVIIALNYSGRWDITQAVQHVLRMDSPHDVTEAAIARHLSLYGIPEPDLLIRTGGETRLSNFLLWQLAYTELYFTKTHWPNFGRDNFQEALRYYASRDRRFGLLSKQSPEKEGA